MNIWIVTTGSSDVQFTADDDKWNRLYRKVRSQIKTSHKFSPTPRPNDDTGEAFLVPARVMGMVYEEQLEDNYGDLYFPLLDAFQAKLQGENTPNRIIVILTDQEQVFTAQERTERNCPYWQDTCKLRLIIERYLNDKFTSATIEEPIYLKPQSKEEGLDNWDKALALVTKKLSKIKVDEKDNIYVSHQASTPAISSAVQFVSLARFGKQVQFLVSNEYEKKPLAPIKSSSYLKGIKLQEAKALLERFDYEGLERLFSFLISDWENPSDTNAKEIHDLLEMAILWNCAEFEKFAKARGGEAKARLEDVNNWWWTAYEAAYLGVVRLKQGNVVEALFHSFRALEGLIKEWALSKYQYPQIQYSNPRQPKTPYFHGINLPSNLQEWFNLNRNNRFNNVGLFGKPLFTLLKASHRENKWNQNPDIQVVNGDIIDERNSTFHCLRGLQKSGLFQAWDTQNQEAWEARVLGCLNFIAEPKPHPTSLEEASLMSQVHKKLEKAIAQYEHTP
jgi:hypothetical protein